MKLLALLPGVAFGAVEFFLTKVIVERATAGRMPITWIIVKIVSYAAVLLPVFLLLPRTVAVWFGAGVGAGLPLCALVMTACRLFRKKR